MRIFFIGTVRFSYDCLKALIENKFDVVGVATKKESAFNTDYCDLQPLCSEHNIPIKQVQDINHPNNIKFVKDFNPDIIYCFGWSSLIQKELLSLPVKGIIGFHPAKLPNNKGRHPIIWALCLGLKTTASTFFFMDEGADSGDILSQVEIPVLFEDTAESLYQKITEVAIPQVIDFTTKLMAGTNQRIKQVEEGNSWRKRGKADGQIDFRMSAVTIYNLVRALTRPYVGAHFNYKAQEVKVWETEISNLGLPNDEPGKVLKVIDGGFVVKTADQSIFIKEHNLNSLPKTGEYL